VLRSWPTAHPVVQTLQPGHDWVWCYLDEVSMQHADSGWVEVDLFFQAAGSGPTSA